MCFLYTYLFFRKGGWVHDICGHGICGRIFLLNASSMLSGILKRRLVGQSDVGLTVLVVGSVFNRAFFLTPTDRNSRLVV